MRSNTTTEPEGVNNEINQPILFVDGSRLLMSQLICGIRPNSQRANCDGSAEARRRSVGRAEARTNGGSGGLVWVEAWGRHNTTVDRWLP